MSSFYFELFMIGLVMLVSILVYAATFKKHRNKKTVRDLTDRSNIVPFVKRREQILEENLKMFLDAENALANEQNAKYIALNLKALEKAKKNLKIEALKEEKAG